VLVNGRPVGEPGQIYRRGESLFIPQELEPQIARALRAECGPNVPVLPPGLGKGPLVLLPPSGSHAHGRVVIDPGHGGSDPGTHAANGVTEKTVTLAIATAVTEDLRARGVEVVMTRTGDQYPDLDDRVRIANASGASLFVSIHADANDDRSKQGFTIILPEASSPATLTAGRDIYARLGNSGAVNHGMRKDNRGLRVLRKTTIPALLIETGFLSNPSEAAKLTSGAYQQRIASAIADGIVDYLNGR
jgi:N-acetylmuramoyl-L-alanine amidase